MTNRIKKFVIDHKTEMIFIAGAAVGALAVYSQYHGKTLLELPANAIQRMKTDGISIAYDVPGEGLFVLMPIPEK